MLPSPADERARCPVGLYETVIVPLPPTARVEEDTPFEGNTYFLTQGMQQNVATSAYAHRRSRESTPHKPLRGAGPPAFYSRESTPTCGSVHMMEGTPLCNSPSLIGANAGGGRSRECTPTSSSMRYSPTILPSGRLRNTPPQSRVMYPHTLQEIEEDACASLAGYPNKREETEGMTPRDVRPFAETFTEGGSSITESAVAIDSSVAAGASR